jgi:hypothetical protein
MHMSFQLHTEGDTHSHPEESNGQQTENTNDRPDIASLFDLLDILIQLRISSGQLEAAAMETNLRTLGLVSRLTISSLSLDVPCS